MSCFRGSKTEALFTSLVDFVDTRGDDVWNVFFFCSRVLKMSLKVHSECCHTPLDLLRFQKKTIKGPFKCISVLLSGILL